MKTLISIFVDIIRFFKPTSRKGAIRLALLIVAVVVGFRFLGPAAEVVVVEPGLPTVRVSTVSELSGDSLFELIGSVEATNQSSITAEASGRVTKVYVELGETVVANQIIAELENAAEYASLLQAEGAYEAAVASAATSDVGVETAKTSLLSAQNSAISTYRSAYSAVSAVVYNNIDDIFKDSSALVPGVRIDGGSYTSYLNNTRISLQTSLPEWKNNSASLSGSDDLVVALEEASSQVSAILEMTDVIIDRLTADFEEYENGEFGSLRALLIADRSSLNNTLASLDTAKSSLQQATDSLRQAELSGTNGDVSVANAQVKQALGSLRSAQARYADTIVRSPIAGVVNVLEVKVGDFVSMQQLVASVANNNALEIATFVGEKDRELIEVGQVVLIENKYPGVISTVAPAINPLTKKVEVKIQTESDALANGDTVTMSVERTDGVEAEVDAPIMVPLTAVKFTATDGSIFVVKEGKLESVPVELGSVVGSSVVIVSGIDSQTEIVIDARGLTAGTSVEALTE